MLESLATICCASINSSATPQVVSTTLLAHVRYHAASGIWRLPSKAQSVLTPDNASRSVPVCSIGHSANTGLYKRVVSSQAGAIVGVLGELSQSPLFSPSANVCTVGSIVLAKVKHHTHIAIRGFLLHARAGKPFTSLEKRGIPKSYQSLCSSS